MGCSCFGSYLWMNPPVLITWVNTVGRQQLSSQFVGDRRYVACMSSEFTDAVSALDALFMAIERCTRAGRRSLTSQERQMLYERFKTVERRLIAYQYRLINQLSAAPVEELGGELSDVLADRLRISRDEAIRRIREAKRLGR